MAAEGEAAALEFTPTWIVAAVCSLIVLISLLAERGLHYLGKVCMHALLSWIHSAVLLDTGLFYARSPADGHGANLGDRPACNVLQKLKKKKQRRPLYEALLKIKEGASIFPPCFSLQDSIDEKRG